MTTTTTRKQCTSAQLASCCQAKGIDEIQPGHGTQPTAVRWSKYSAVVAGHKQNNAMQCKGLPSCFCLSVKQIPYQLTQLSRGLDKQPPLLIQHHHHHHHQQQRQQPAVTLAKQLMVFCMHSKPADRALTQNTACRVNHAGQQSILQGTTSNVPSCQVPCTARQQTELSR